MAAMNAQSPCGPAPKPGLPLSAKAGEKDASAHVSPTAECPPTPEQMQAMTLAKRRAKKLRSAARLAQVNGGLLGIFSGLSGLFVAGEALFGEFDWLGAIMCVGLGILAWNELRGRRELLRFNLKAPALLGWNQLALLILIVAYAAWMMGKTVFGPNPYDQAMQAEPMSVQVLGNISSLYKTLSVLLYGALIVGTLIFQGLTSRYYFTRAPLLRAYLAETPAWVIELQRQEAAR